LEGRGERERERERGGDWERTVVVLTIEHTMQARRLREEDISGELQSSFLDQRALVRILYTCGP
jgi:hypothetical protein